MTDLGLPSATSNLSLHSPLEKPGPQASLSPGSEMKSKQPQSQSQPGQKRRPSRAGTRSVSTLTAAQLERKRANDREAQRAIRQRTKDHIESLERRIAELTATSDTSAKLVQALQRNEELEQENAILRTRLNHAVAAMSENGAVPAEAISIAAAGPTSPTRRMKLNTSLRPSSIPSPAPRSAPPTAVQSSIPPQDSWGGPYTPVSTTIERSPSLSDLSPAPSNMRWAPPHHQLTPPVSEPDRMMQPIDQGLDPGVQPPVPYNYIVDGTGRAVHYQGESPMTSYPQTTSPPPPLQDYQSRHSSAPLAHTPPFPSYPPHPEYMAPPQHEEHGTPMMQNQPQHLMYNMPPNMKSHQ